MEPGWDADEVFEARGRPVATASGLAAAILAVMWGIGFFGGPMAPGVRAMFLFFGAFAAFAIVRQALVRIRVGPSALVAVYVLHRRTVPYADIVGLEIESRSVSPDGKVAADFIVVRRRRGFALRLGVLYDLPEAFGLLQKRWAISTHRAEP